MASAISSGAVPGSRLQRWLERPWFLLLWCGLGAFGTYLCMYGFRKPFTAGTFADTAMGQGYKVWLVTSQVLGYTLSKFIGIKLIAEMTRARRVRALLGLIAGAELALLGFAAVPAPYQCGFLFLNGLALGMVFGLVLGFLEGRRMTEAFVAGLCASFIVADGLAKSVGAWLVKSGVSEAWMPFVAGLVFTAPLLVFVLILAQTPSPTTADRIERSERLPMDRRERWTVFRRHALGLSLIVLGYLAITVLRSVRADFGPEIWRSLGTADQPAVFTQSELWVAVGVVAANGLIAMVRDNRRAFTVALVVSAAGLAMVLGSLVALRAGGISAFPFMVFLGLGLYLPYVAVHTTVFERFVAFTRERANIGYLMYVADAMGYLGYVLVMLGKRWWWKGGDFLAFFQTVGAVVALVALAAFAGAGWALAYAGERR